MNMRQSPFSTVLLHGRRLFGKPQVVPSLELGSWPTYSAADKYRMCKEGKEGSQCRQTWVDIKDIRTAGLTANIGFLTFVIAELFQD